MTGRGRDEARYHRMVETVRRGPPPGRPSFAGPPPPLRCGMPQAMAPDLAQVTQLAMLEALGCLGEDQPAGGAAGAGRAPKRLYAFKDKVRSRLREVVADYLEEITHTMHVVPGDAWALADYTERIAWGEFHGMHRVHRRCSNI